MFTEEREVESRLPGEAKILEKREMVRVGVGDENWLLNHVKNGRRYRVV